MGRMQTVFLLCGWSSHAKAHPAEYQCRFTHIHLQSVWRTHSSRPLDQIYNSSIRHTDTHADTDTHTCKMHTQRYKEICTCKSRGWKDKKFTYTHKTMYTYTHKTMLNTKSETHYHYYSFSHTHAAELSSHTYSITVTHPSARSMYAAEKTDWVCLFVCLLGLLSMLVCCASANGKLAS